MSQGAHVILNAANTRQQIPLRDYLNARVAPFLKKAITQSLDAEAEFPLQWLGECLIHQSILYEGNPDRTNIREKFVYNFDDPKPQEQAKADSSTAPATSAQPAIEVPTPQQPEVSMNEANDGGTAERPLLETHEYVLPQMADTVGGPTVNGTKDEVEQAPERAGVDTEMGGTN